MKLFLKEQLLFKYLKKFITQIYHFKNINISTLTTQHS